MNKQEQQEQELKSLHYLIEQIEAGWITGYINEDGDRVISEKAATRINMLLEQ